MYFENLYKEIISKNCKKYTHLRIIAGYASASFLEKVTSSYPHLSIDLFIGMSNEGISQKNHKLFLEMQNMQNVNIFYQIKNSQPTHMKIYEFYNANEKKQYIGSPNFSENGFIKNREILIEADEELDDLFDYQKNISMLCDDNSISSYIHFYDEKEKSSESNIDETDSENDFLVRSPGKGSGQAESKNSTSIPPGLKGFRRNHVEYKYLNLFSVKIAPSEDDKNQWHKTGINKGFVGEIPVLNIGKESPYLYKFFEPGADLTFYTKDGGILEAKLTGKYDRDLMLLEDNWFNFICNHLNLDKNKPISEEQLQALGYKYIEFKQIDKFEYQMKIEKN